MLEFTPLSGPYVPIKGEGAGADQVEQPKALAYLLEIDEIRILLDCGAPEECAFDAMHSPVGTAAPELVGTLPEVLERISPSIDVLLLTHSQLPHLGLYAYARAHWGLQCATYATFPVQTMGRLTMLEALQSWSAEVDLKHAEPRRYLPTEAEIDEAFDAIRSIRYMQPTPLDGACAERPAGC